MPAGVNSWLVHQNSLAILPADIWEPVGGTDEGVRILHISIWNMSMDLWHAIKCYDMGPLALLPIRRKVCCRLFITQFEPVTLGSSGKCTNHYTTEVAMHQFKWLWFLSNVSVLIDIVRFSSQIFIRCWLHRLRCTIFASLSVVTGTVLVTFLVSLCVILIETMWTSYWPCSGFDTQ
jgi:hypothetical protein